MISRPTYESCIVNAWELIIFKIIYLNNYYNNILMLCQLSVACIVKQCRAQVGHNTTKIKSWVKI